MCDHLQVRSTQYARVGSVLWVSLVCANPTVLMATALHSVFNVVGLRHRHNAFPATMVCRGPLLPRGKGYTGLV